MSPATIDHIVKPRNLGQTNYIKIGKTLKIKDTYNNKEKHVVEPVFTKAYTEPLQKCNPDPMPKVKVEFEEHDFESKITAHSIIGQFIKNYFISGH